MLKLLKYMKGKQKHAVFAGLTKFFEAAIELLLPLLMASIINILNSDKDFTKITYISTIMIVLALLSTTLTIIGQKNAAISCHYLGYNLKNDLFKHIMSLSKENLININNESLINILNNDTAIVEKAFGLFIRLALRCFLIIIGGLILAFTLSFNLSFIFLLLVLFEGVIIYCFMKRSISLYKKTQNNLDNISKSSKDYIKGIRVIKAFNTSNDEEDEFEELNNIWLDSGVIFSKTSFMITPLISIVMHISISGLLVIFHLLTKNNNNLTPGILIGFISYVNIITNSIIQFTNLSNNFSKAISCSKRINYIFSITPKLEYGSKDSLDDTKTVLEIDNIKFAYKNKEVININQKIVVNAGESLGVIGVTASSKTTLMLLIKRLIDPKEGNIYFYKTNIKKYTKEFLNKNISIVFQNDTLLNDTIYNNVTMSNKLDESDVYKVLEIVLIKDFVLEKKEKLNYLINSNANNLSGGQKTRLAIARALLSNPKILILDDSFSNLDNYTSYTIKNNILKNYKDIVIVYVSQRINVVKDTTKILLLDHGCIKGYATHDELLDNSLYQEILTSQQE